MGVFVSVYRRDEGDYIPLEQVAAVRRQRKLRSVKDAILTSISIRIGQRGGAIASLVSCKAL